VMATYMDRARPDPAVFVPVNDTRYFSNRPSFDPDTAQSNLQELKRQEIAGVTVAPSDENRFTERQRMLDHTLVDRMKESAQASFADAEAAKQKAGIKVYVEQRQAELDMIKNGDPDNLMIPVTPAAVPVLYRDTKEKAELNKLQSELQAVRGVNAATLTPPWGLYGDWGHQCMPPHRMPPYAAAAATQQESMLLNEAAQLRQEGNPTHAAILERRAAELGWGVTGFRAPPPGAKFPGDVPHSVEQEPHRAAAVPSSRQMMEAAAQSYGLDLYGLESARVFEQGWHLREWETVAARAREEEQAREQYQSRQLQLKHAEAEAAARARMDAETAYKLRALQAAGMDTELRASLGIGKGTSDPNQEAMERNSPMAISASDSRLVRKMA